MAVELATHGFAWLLGVWCGSLFVIGWQAIWHGCDDETPRPPTQQQ